jgi:hypothetical protein
VTIIDVVLVLSAQPGHALHQGVGVPHLDLLDADPHFDDLTDEPGRHRVAVVLHLERTAVPYPQPPAFLRLQALCRQSTQGRQLGHQGRLTPAVALHH